MSVLKFAESAGLAALLVAGGLMIATVPAQAQSTLQTVNLRLDWLPSGYHAPLFLALAKDYYKQQGIDLQIADGKGTNPALQAVAAGNDMIVLANHSTMIQSIAKGMPVMAVGGLIQRLPDSVISLKGSGIKTPKDLEGRVMAIPPASAAFKLFPAFAAAARIDTGKIKIVQTDSSAVLTALLQGQVVAATGWAFTDAVKVSTQKPIEPPILMSDYGVNVLGNGFVIKKETAAAKGELIKRFMAATAKGYEEGAKAPEAAVDAMVQARPNVDRDLMLAQLKQLPHFFATDRSKGHPFGWTAPEDWSQTVELLKKYFEMTETVDVASLYTNDFVPSK